MSEHNKPLRALRLPRVVEKTGISRSHIYRMVKHGTFPSAYHLTEGGSIAVWNESEIDGWLKAKFGGGQDV
jgi:prophage regulatory protein